MGQGGVTVDRNVPIEDRVERGQRDRAIAKFRPWAVKAGWFSFCFSILSVPFLWMAIIGVFNPGDRMPPGCVGLPFIAVASVATLVDYGLVFWSWLIGGRVYWNLILLGFPGAVISTLVMLRVASVFW